MKREYVIQTIENDKIKIAIYELEEGEKQTPDNYVGTYDFTIGSYLKEKRKGGEREFFNEEIIAHLLNEPIQGIDPTYSKLLVMFTMQEELNVHTNGPDYKETKICAKTGKPINYRRAAWMEAVEFVDSFDWKHWKHKKDDIENAKTELVDIWHFLLSEALLEHQGVPNEQLLFDIESILNEFYQKPVLMQDITDNYPYLFGIAEDFVTSVLQNKQSPFFYLPTYHVEMNTAPISRFFEMCHTIGLSYNELYQRYIIKNVLNRFRLIMDTLKALITRYGTAKKIMHMPLSWPVNLVTN